MTTLITGATGKTGTRIIERLTAAGVAVRPASRATGFFWEDPSSWPAALDGVDAAYIAYYPDLAMPGAAETVAAFARAAAAAGVGRLVLLSGRGEPEALRAEQEVAAAGVPTTVVRCSWFAQNFSESIFLDGVLNGDVALPADDTPEPFVDAEDIADVVAAALTDPRHRGRTYELTGPRALTFAEVAAELSRATGRTIKYTPITPEQYEQVLVEASLPVELGEMFRGVLDGRNTKPADGVQEALGRPARDFAAYAGRAAAAGSWG